MTTENRLKLVDESPDTPKPSLLDDAGASMLFLGLKTLSQRTIVALSNAFTLLTCASAFWLWQDVLPNPNVYQLIGLFLYGVFLLALHIVRRK